MVERCPDCGVVLGLVGPETHKRMCRGYPAPVGTKENPVLILPVKQAKKFRAAPPRKVEPRAVLDAAVAAATLRQRRWREKNRDKYNANMRAYRAKGKVDGAAETASEPRRG
jgi:hypothetical protein